MRGVIRLYTTAGCHLCEQAEAMVMYLLENEQQFGDKFELLEVEIAGNEALVERFGIRIPVLESKAGELGWPFELEDLIAWLNKALGIPK